MSCTQIVVEGEGEAQGAQPSCRYCLVFYSSAANAGKGTSSWFLPEQGGGAKTVRHADAPAEEL